MRARQRRLIASTFAGMWYAPEFAGARRMTYAVIAVMFVMMMVLPVHYACAGSTSHCFGCGFRTATTLMIHGEMAEAVASNGLILPASGFMAAMVADLLRMAWRLRASKVI